MSPIFSEALTEAFYRWELRGRGWHGTDEFVMLEPAFEPFTVPYTVFERPTPQDDGLRPTLLGSLAKLITGETSNSQALAVVEADEPDTLPLIIAPDSETTMALDIRVPASFVSRADTALIFLRALSAAQSPIAFEMVGVAGEVHIQLNVRESDVPHVRASLEGYFPDIAVIEDASDRLLRAWEDDEPGLIVDFGLSNEFFLPLSLVANYTIDPFIPLVGALANAGLGETLCYQVLFERVRNPWRQAIRDAVAGPDGGGIFVDAPDFVRLAHEKADTPLFVAVLRIAGQAESVERAKSLVQSALGFIGQYERLPGNHFIPLTNEGYDDRQHMCALLLRESHRAGMILNTSELAALVHMPDMSVRQSALNRVATRTKAAPPSFAEHALHLGTNVHRGQRLPMRVPTVDRLAHMHIIGASGTGKSTLLTNAALQDIAQGHGVAVLDPHGDLIDDIIARLPDERIHDVILFDPSDTEHPIGLNILSAHHEWEREHLAADVVGMFERLATSWGDSMGSVLSNAVLAIVESKRGGTLLDLRRFLLEPETRKAYLAEIEDDEIRLFWEKSFALIGTRSIGPILTRLDGFLRPKTIRRIVGQKTSSFAFHEVLSGRHILLAKLSHGLLGEANASLLGSLIVSELHQAALARQRLAKTDRTPAFIYIDEFQHFVTPSMASLLSEGRKFSTGLILAHQTLSQIQGSSVESAVMGNAYTRIAFRVGENDAAKLASGYSFFEARDLLSLERGQAIGRFGSAEHDCNLATEPPSDLADTQAKVKMAAVVASSRRQFGALTKELGPETVTENEPSEQSAETEVAVEPEREETITRSPADFLPVIQPKGRYDGKEHKYLTQLVARLGQERGFLATLEEPVGTGRVDVALRRDGMSIACEVTVTTEVTHELGNARKCVAGGYNHVVLISTDTGKQKRLQEALVQFDDLKIVGVFSPEELALFLDSLNFPAPTDKIVRGYKVRVKRQPQSPNDVAARRDVIGKIVTRSIRKDE